MRRLLVLAALPPLLAGLCFVGTCAAVSIDEPPRLDAATRAALIAPLRAVLSGAPAPAAAPGLARALDGGGPVIASLWLDGDRVLRVEGRGGTLGEAVTAAARALAADPGLAALDGAARSRARLQVDVVTARGLLLRRPELIGSLGVLPGIDGVGVRVSGREVLVGPDELTREGCLDSVQPLAGVPDFKAGLDLVRADALLARRAALGAGGFHGAGREYFRFRVDSTVESPGGGPPLPLRRGLVPRPPLDKATMRAAAIAGGRYLMRSLNADGTFVYELNLASGEATPPEGDYSLPRHAGATYYLAQLYRSTQDPAVRIAAELAMTRLAALAGGGPCRGQAPSGEPFLCVPEPGGRVATLGSTALAVVALAEYRLATGDTRYDELQRQLAAWIKMMQLPDGRFAHVYYVPQRQRNEKLRLLYFDGEAALALVRHNRSLGDPEALAGAERAIDYLMGWYDFFAGQFFFGEEHWTCIAAEAAWPDLRHDRYREFCSDYATFLRGQQYSLDENPLQPENAGAYGIAQLVVPRNTPAGSRSEAMISAYQLTLHHGKPDERIRQQVLAAMHFLLGQQVRPENDFWIRAENAHGAIPGSATDPVVRIDYIQHACSALLRVSELPDP